MMFNMEEQTEKKVEKKTTKKTTKKQEVPERAKAENIEQLVVEIAKKEKSPAKIGLILKEKHNVNNLKALGKKITKILKENNIEYTTDLDNVNTKIERIEKHSQKNKQDKRANRELVRFIGLRKKIEKYNAKKNKTL
jgi:ribosomal protein S15P/S13E